MYIAQWHDGLKRSGKAGMSFRTTSVQDDPTWRRTQINSLVSCWMLIAERLRVSQQRKSEYVTKQFMLRFIFGIYMQEPSFSIFCMMYILLFLLFVTGDHSPVSKMTGFSPIRPFSSLMAVTFMRTYYARGGQVLRPLRVYSNCSLSGRNELCSFEHIHFFLLSPRSYLLLFPSPTSPYRDVNSFP